MTAYGRVLLLGDATVDWHILKTPDSDADTACWRNAGGDIAARPGGASLLRNLVEQCLPCEVGPDEGEFLGGAHPSASALPWSSLSQTMAICGLFPQETQSRNKVIRIESLCGFRPPQSLRPLDTQWTSGTTPRAVVVDDAGLGIRTQVSQLLDALSSLPRDDSRNAPWIILKVAWPVLDSPLLSELVKHWGRQLIVIAPVDDLRRDSIQISRGLSWERTAQDLSWEFNYNPRLKRLAGVRALAVPIGLSGVWLSRNDTPTEPAQDPAAASVLVFDPACIEGDWEKERPGLLLGYTSCLTLGLLGAILSEGRTDLAQASRCGLSAMRALHTHGYRMDTERRAIELPIDQMRQAFEHPVQFPSVTVPLGYRHYSVPAGKGTGVARTAEWSILKESVGSPARLFDLAMQIVRDGTAKSLGTIPFARFGALVTVDREEIEAFRTTYDLIQDYCRNAVLHRPLSLAVFGPPGSGKSFGVAQVAKAVAGGSIEKITFNVSQFTCHGDLIDALHRVRDIGLSGRTPLVFWDEFDSMKDGQRLFWLKAFLAPMQDGEFAQGQISHPIGRAIFVFAGGTATSVDGLGSGLPDGDYRSAKVPDFKSRLRGCVNIVGIDRVKKGYPRTDGAFESDPQYVVRRAVVLRSIIERVRPDVFEGSGRANIDEGLLKALLSVWSFKHGVRSLESIVELCHLGDVGMLHRSSLPPQDVLSLHVDTAEFLGLVTADVEFRGAELEVLAAAHHEMYRKNSPGSPLAGFPYERLSEEDKEKNRAAVRGIAHKLASIGYEYEVALATDIDCQEGLADADAEQLGRLEHDRWIVAAIDNGYVYGQARDNTGFPKRHPDLVPWDEMDATSLHSRYPEVIASKLGPGPLRNAVDREMAGDIPEIMRRAGYVVRKL